MTRRLLLIVLALSLFSLAYASTFEYDGALAAVRRVPVPTAPRTQTTQLIDGGVFDCDGYKSIVLNLAGEVKDPTPKGGKLGAILIPDVDPFPQAFQQLGLLPVTIEIDVTLKPGAAYFMAEPKRADVGFPRYRVLFYNETGASVNASFFAYRGR
ncbi:MAG TPA: hypothetical protein VJ826_13700 [Candidatus Polarisedimenticolaceae bacterium]|nr:hypothetical protein [Candidatus Polarisedimenticolaceae bacterium]